MGERGYGSVLAVSLLLGGVLLIGLAADVARLVVAWRETSFLAHTAAETGAGWVQPDPLYSGSLLLDEGAATDAARAVAGRDGHDVAVTVSSGRICVSVGTTVKPGLVRLIGGSGQSVRVIACASPRQG